MNYNFLLTLTLLIAHAVRVGAAEISATFDADRRGYQISGPGIEQFQAGFSATVEIAGQRHVLTSRDGVVSPKLSSDSEQTPYGRAKIRVATVSFPEHNLALQLRLGEIPGEPCVRRT